MDSFILDLNTDSTLANDAANSSQSHLDWTAFQSAPPPTTNSPFSPLWVSQHDDAVAPNNRSTLVATPHDEEIYGEIEHFFSGLNEQQQIQSLPLQPQGIIEPVHVNITIPDQTMNDREHAEPTVSTHSARILDLQVYLVSSTSIPSAQRTSNVLFTNATCTTRVFLTVAMLS